MSRLVLIDGNAILHRAYHALPVLTNRNGQQVNAVYGFASIMLRILDELKPEYFAVAFDRPEPTFRKQEYFGYQAKRKEMDAELAGQIDLVHELVEAYGVKIFEKAGYEADDVIGSLAKQATDKCKVQSEKRKIMEVIIVTGDRDLMQLVNDKVKLYMPTRGMSEGEVVDIGGVRERLGVLPEQVVDYKALVGDSSDNYPGVPGVGPKGAITLINRYGNFNNIMKAVGVTDDATKKSSPNADNTDISELVKQKLIKGRESGELSYRLATIKTDVEVDLELDKLRVSGLDQDRLTEFFRQMGFRSLEKRLGDGDTIKEKVKKAEEQQQTLF